MTRRAAVVALVSTAIAGVVLGVATALVIRVVAQASIVILELFVRSV